MLDGSHDLVDSLGDTGWRNLCIRRKVFATGRHSSGRKLSHRSFLRIRPWSCLYRPKKGLWMRLILRVHIGRFTSWAARRVLLIFWLVFILFLRGLIRFCVRYWFRPFRCSSFSGSWISTFCFIVNHITDRLRSCWLFFIIVYYGLMVNCLKVWEVFYQPGL